MKKIYIYKFKMKTNLIMGQDCVPKSIRNTTQNAVGVLI